MPDIESRDDCELATPQKPGKHGQEPTPEKLTQRATAGSSQDPAIANSQQSDASAGNAKQRGGARPKGKTEDY